MSIPLYDENKLKHIRFQWMTLLIIAANILLWLLMAYNGEESSFTASVVLGLGFIPSIASGIIELSPELLLHPRVRIWTLTFGRIPLPLPSYVMIGLWILFQFYMLIIDFDGQVSWGAHVGGILAGAILVLFMKPKSVKLFQKLQL